MISRRWGTAPRGLVHLNPKNPDSTILCSTEDCHLIMPLYSYFIHLQPARHVTDSSDPI